MITANGPKKFDLNANANSPLNKKAMECPKPCPGQKGMPARSIKQNVFPVVYGFMVAIKTSPVKKAIHSKCFEINCIGLFIFKL